MENSEYPNVLVISNNCFSRSGSNGRTLAGLFTNWPLQRIAQFYIKDETPDHSVCANYYRVTDMEALRSVLYRKQVAGGTVQLVTEDNSGTAAPTSATGVKKTPLTALLRNMAWSFGAWASNGFTAWAEEVDPEVVLLQAGDSPFMYAIATHVAQRLSIPLVIYNSEDYYFKATNFMSQNTGWFAERVYSVFLRSLRKQTERAIEYASYSFYICDKLRGTYEERFHAPGMTVMTATSVSPTQVIKANQTPVISYLGNLGLGRHESLIEIGRALQRIDAGFHLDVYGRADGETLDELENAPGIRYRGFIPYEETREVLAASDLLVHVESFSPFYRQDLRHAFSTKIADSLASGTCLMVYAPADLACTEYLSREDSACVVTEPSDLADALRRLLESGDLRQRYVERALETVARNHTFETSTVRFRDALRAVTHGPRDRHDSAAGGDSSSCES